MQGCLVKFTFARGRLILAYPCRILNQKPFFKRQFQSRSVAVLEGGSATFVLDISWCSTPCSPMCSFSPERLMPASRVARTCLVASLSSTEKSARTCKACCCEDLDHIQCTASTSSRRVKSGVLPAEAMRLRIT